MNDRDECILAHLGLYRLSFRAILADVFFDGRTPANVLARLTRQGRLRSRPGLPDRLSYYQLTPGEAKRRGLPEARARPLGAQALQTHIGVLWFCFCSPAAYRRRLDRHELRKHLGRGFENAPHCLQGGDIPLIWRLYVTGERSNDATLIKHIVANLDGLAQTTTLGPWIAARRYAITILAESEGRRFRLKEMIRRHGLNARTQYSVGYCPSPGTLAAALRKKDPVRPSSHGSPLWSGRPA